MTDRMTAAHYAAQVIANKKRKNPEADIQRSIVKALRRALPHALVHASINEQRKGNRRDQGIATGMGAHPGFADLLVMCERRMLFIEVKSATGRLSEAQDAFRDWVLAEGSSSRPGHLVATLINASFEAVSRGDEPPEKDSATLAAIWREEMHTGSQDPSPLRSSAVEMRWPMASRKPPCARARSNR